MALVLGVHRSAALLLLASCGARTDVDLLVSPLVDASASPGTPDVLVRPTDATVDARVPRDAALDRRAPVDAGVDALAPIDASSLDAADAGADVSMSCSTPVVDIGECGIPSCCKFGVTWTCGGETFSIAGGCQVTNGGYEGVCSVNGATSSTFMAASTSCLCNDAGALGAFVTSLCEVSPPPSPP
jgi:hypothetical protein